MKTFCLVLCLVLVAYIAPAQNNGKGAVVAASKMNVLYRGISNPVEIAVPGITSELVTAVVSNGTIKKVADGWEVIPGDQDKTIITVLVNNTRVSEKEFRIKNIPVPQAYFAGKNNGTTSKDLAGKTELLEVRLPDFVWDLKFTITSFRMMYTRDNKENELVSLSNKLTDEMKTVLAGFKRGETIIFKDIIALGPDGRTKDLSPVILKID